MRFSTLFTVALLPLAFAHPTPTSPEARDLDLHQEYERGNWWEAGGWRGAENHRRPGPSPSSSGRSRHHQRPKRDVPSDLPLGTLGDLTKCPAQMMACPVSVIIPELVTADTEWECVSPQEDLYSCGGCSTLGTGSDCTAIPSVLSVSCQTGSCHVHSCASGFAPSSDGKSCIAEFVVQ